MRPLLAHSRHAGHEAEQEGFKAAESQSQGWLLCSHVSEQLWEGTEAPVP